MKVHKWSSMWFVWYKRYKVLGMVLLVLAAGIFVFCDKSHDESVESIAVLQTTDTAEATVQVSYHQTAQCMLDMGLAFSSAQDSLRDMLWRFLADILPENGYLHVAGGIPILQMNEGHITKITLRDISALTTEDTCGEKRQEQCAQDMDFMTEH